MMQFTSAVRISIVADRSTCAPMTWGQVAMWDVLEWINPHEALLNLSAVLRVPRGTTADCALEAIRQLVLRHESLRTNCFTIDGELRQCVNEEAELDVLIAEAASENGVAALAHSTAAQLANDAFDISCGVQLRVALIVRAGSARAIALVASHMAVDAGSFQIVQGELKTLLAPAGGRDRLPPRSQQPIERAGFEASPAGAKLQDGALAFWRESMSLASPASISRLPAPADHELAWASIESRALTLATRDLAARYRVRPSAVILASLGLLIGEFTGQPGPAFRSLIATRFRPHDRAFVGPFNLNSVIHVATDSQLFADHVRRTSAAALRAFLHCEADQRQVNEVINDVAADRGIITGSYCFINDTSAGQAPETDPAAAADPADIAAAAKETRISALPYQGRQKDSKFFMFVHALQPFCMMRLCKDRRFIPDVSPAEFFGSLENLIVSAASTPGISVQELLADAGP